MRLLLQRYLPPLRQMSFPRRQTYALDETIFRHPARSKLLGPIELFLDALCSFLRIVPDSLPLVEAH
jgi:hypothetical protein